MLPVAGPVRTAPADVDVVQRLVADEVARRLPGPRRAANTAAATPPGTATGVIQRSPVDPGRRAPAAIGESRVGRFDQIDRLADPFSDDEPEPEARSGAGIDVDRIVEAVEERVLRELERRGGRFTRILS